MENSSQKNHLLIFVRNAVAGQVKTRLARSLGNEAALEIYKQLLHVTAMVVGHPSISALRKIYYSNGIENEKRWEGMGAIPYLQKGEDLGERMAYAFQEAFQEGAERVVIVGSDCPYITAGLISEAFTQLENHDCVIGPSEDGGYYLLGSRCYMPFLFENMPWSQAGLYEATREALLRQHHSCITLPVLRDVDDVADYRAWQESMAPSGS